MPTLDDLLYTLDVCERELPYNAHPCHRERLDAIRAILRDRAARVSSAGIAGRDPDTFRRAQPGPSAQPREETA